MVLGSLADPFFLARRGLRLGIARHGPSLQGTVIDIGCGTQPYRHLLGARRYIGLEVHQASLHGSAKNADVYFNGRLLPIASASIDGVLCTQVLEHVFEPAAFLAEIRRVTKPGGHLLLTVPFVWDEHEQPYDFARYSSFGLRHLLQSAGFRVIAAEKTLADPSVLIQLWLGYLFKLAAKWPKPLRVATFVVLAVPSNLLGWVLQKVAPTSPDLYLDNVVLCERTVE